jgi:hypothetical protein
MLTDGYSCSLNFKINDSTSQPQHQESSQYLQQQQKTPTTIIVVDPNKGNLLYAVSGDKSFKYTQKQRRFECKFKQQTCMIKKQVKSSVEAQQDLQELALCSKKTTNIDEFKKYVKKHSDAYDTLTSVYANDDVKKIKFKVFSATKHSDARLVKGSAAAFKCTPLTSVISWGHWGSKGGGHMKYHQPTLNVGFPKIFKKAGFTVCFVDEAYTYIQNRQ